MQKDVLSRPRLVAAQGSLVSTTASISDFIVVRVVLLSIYEGLGGHHACRAGRGRSEERGENKSAGEESNPEEWLHVGSASETEHH